MAAPLGNQFWKLRSKDGRDRTYADAESLWNVALEYFKAMDESPIEFQDNKGTKNVNTIERHRPYSKWSFALYVGVCEWDVIAGWKDISEDFVQVIRTIEQCILSQQWEGAVVGLFKENIIARTMGLTDKNETTLKGVSQQTFLEQFQDAKTEV